jgi:hypothetical protein
MDDAALLASFEWSPSSLADIDEMPERTLWLLVSYRNGLADKMRNDSAAATRLHGEGPR